MNTWRILLGLGLLALVTPAAMAQGLGDVAAHERESREKDKKKSGVAPVFTNHDLDARRPPGSEDRDEAVGEAAATGSYSAPEGGEQESEGEREEARQVDLTSQTQAVNQAQAEVDGITRRIRELNNRLNPMSRDYVYGAATTGDAAGEEIRIRNELSELQDRLVGARAELARANEALNDARRGRRSRTPEPQ